jgi:hypothetical protein
MGDYSAGCRWGRAISSLRNNTLAMASGFTIRVRSTVLKRSCRLQDPKGTEPVKECATMRKIRNHRFWERLIHNILCRVNWNLLYLVVGRRENTVGRDG